MSMYDNNEKDSVYYELKEFLKEHSISELMKIVADAIYAKEEGYLN